MSDDHSSEIRPHEEPTSAGVSIPDLEKRAKQLKAEIQQLAQAIQQATGQLNQKAGALAELENLISELRNRGASPAHTSTITAENPVVTDPGGARLRYP